jgi:protein-S-isoprenylcysteine O-methyltransferase Ste14
VRRDEERLAERFGPAYLEYRARVKRWIPALF